MTLSMTLSLSIVLCFHQRNTRQSEQFILLGYQCLVNRYAIYRLQDQAMV